MSAKSAPLPHYRKPSGSESYYNRRRSAVSEIPPNPNLNNVNHHQHPQQQNSAHSHHKPHHRRTRSAVSSLFKPIHLPSFDKGMIPLHDMNSYKVSDVKCMQLSSFLWTLPKAICFLRLYIECNIYIHCP